MEKPVKTQPTLSDDELLNQLLFCVRCLMAERPGNEDARQLLSELNAMEFSTVWTMFRALVNTRKPLPADPDLLRIQDQVLQELIARDGVEDVANFVSTPYDDRISLWMGDINGRIYRGLTKSDSDRAGRIRNPAAAASAGRAGLRRRSRRKKIYR